MIRILISILLAASLSACNLVYRQDIQQGNVLEEDLIEQLAPGMTKRQVTVLLGSPAVQSPFHSDRWDYVSTFSKRGGRTERRYLTLMFEDDRLVDFHGDYLDKGSIPGASLRGMRIRASEDTERVIPDEEPEMPTPLPPVD